MADVVIDTTGLTIHQLKSRLTELFAFVAGERETLPHRPDYQRQFTHSGGLLDDTFAPPDVQLIHVVRLYYALGRFDPERGRGSFWWNDHV
ncbi:MAG: hypothetical protein HC793_05255 [Aquincola sp.]|nr:hypothetical protein [Aquincola sp.]